MPRTIAWTSPRTQRRLAEKPAHASQIEAADAGITNGGSKLTSVWIKNRRHVLQSRFEN